MPTVSSSAAEVGDNSQDTCAAIVGVRGHTLSAAEAELFRARPPLGFILFARNCSGRSQVRDLVTALRAAVGRGDAPILIDQEGGRVARLGPPVWRKRSPLREIGRLHARAPDLGLEAARLHARLIAADLAELGITVDCAPVLDLGLDNQTEALGDRTYAPEPERVSALGHAAIEGFIAGGVTPVIKHLPGHGRAKVDSHERLPVVDAEADVLEATDMHPFKGCCRAPLAMTAHVCYPALDQEGPATLSARIIQEVIRDIIGFDGILLSDDLSMGALGGPLGERAARARAAGCDLALHCNGDLAEARAVLDAAGAVDSRLADRLRHALHRPTAAPLDREAAEARLEHLMASQPALRTA